VQQDEPADTIVRGDFEGADKLSVGKLTGTIPVVRLPDGDAPRCQVPRDRRPRRFCSCPA